MSRNLLHIGWTILVFARNLIFIEVWCCEDYTFLFIFNHKSIMSENGVFITSLTVLVIIWKDKTIRYEDAIIYWAHNCKALWLISQHVITVYACEKYITKYINIHSKAEKSRDKIISCFLNLIFQHWLFFISARASVLCLFEIFYLQIPWGILLQQGFVLRRNNFTYCLISSY